MAIKDLQARQGNVDLTVEVTDKGDVREFEKFGRKGRVCNAKVKDSTGEIAFTLWNEDIDKVNVGDKVKIQNGWVGEWQGELQLSTGKFGSMEVIGEGDETVDEAVEEDLADNPPHSDEGEHILTKDETAEEMEAEKIKEEGKTLTEDQEMEEEVLEKLNEDVPIEESVSDDEAVEEEDVDELGKEPQDMDASDMTDEEKQDL